MRLHDNIELSAPTLSRLFERVVSSGADSLLSPEQQLQRLMQERQRNEAAIRRLSADLLGNSTSLLELRSAIYDEAARTSLAASAEHAPRDLNMIRDRGTQTDETNERRASPLRRSPPVGASALAADPRGRVMATAGPSMADDLYAAVQSAIASAQQARGMRDTPRCAARHAARYAARYAEIRRGVAAGAQLRSSRYSSRSRKSAGRSWRAWCCTDAGGASDPDEVHVPHPGMSRANSRAGSGTLRPGGPTTELSVSVVPTDGTRDGPGEMRPIDELHGMRV